MPTIMCCPRTPKKKKTEINLMPALPALLATAFIVLKVLGLITWPWVWVLAPVWIPLALVVLFTLICVGLTILSKLIIES